MGGEPALGHERRVAELQLAGAAVVTVPRRVTKMNPRQPTAPASAPKPADLAADAFWPIPPGQDSASQTPGLLSLRGSLAAKAGYSLVAKLDSFVTMLGSLAK